MGKIYGLHGNYDVHIKINEEYLPLKFSKKNKNKFNYIGFTLF